jgi:hypothetical protein
MGEVVINESAMLWMADLFNPNSLIGTGTLLEASLGYSSGGNAP